MAQRLSDYRCAVLSWNATHCGCYYSTCGDLSYLRSYRVLQDSTIW